MAALLIKETVEKKIKRVSVPIVLYGVIPGKYLSGSEKYEGNLQCYICPKKFLTTKEIIMHSYGHIVSFARRSVACKSCKYCLEYFTTEKGCLSHQKVVHHMEYMPNCCLICQEKFGNAVIWGQHMNNSHIEADMPYKCDLCGYRTSLHTDVIDHFESEHADLDQVMCPFCLKMLRVETNKDLVEIYVHFNDHKSIGNKKCEKCLLVFLTDAESESHLLLHRDNEASSFAKVGRRLLSFSMEESFQRQYYLYCINPMDDEGNMTEESLKMYIWINLLNPMLNFQKYNNLKCFECKDDVKSENHFIQHIICTKCTYATFCSAGMATHISKCLSMKFEKINMQFICGVNKLKPQSLDLALKCSCEISTRNPDDIAEHLKICKKTTAFPAHTSSHLSEIGVISNSKRSNAKTPEIPMIGM